MAAVVIQSFWRGHRCRRDALWHADRSAAGGDGSSSAVTAERRLELCRAATVIQAVWKGYVLRKRLASALAAVRNTETEEEFAEVDVDEFAFDERLANPGFRALTFQNAAVVRAAALAKAPGPAAPAADQSRHAHVAAQASVAGGGLRDMYTVQLMLKRAQKMKPKKRRDRRAAEFNGTDQIVCFEL
ncbi:hypothetical protein JZ751_003540 [Albula glossodonta]|uniref:Uncharacterized protein n=1 Tax=Albula glossodonta TaxID=121402 RepID=A0A8T2N6G0_9TELE|nr:hypothetical protein JZ751_003540 [Albula glossodonta]